MIHRRVTIFHLFSILIISLLVFSPSANNPSSGSSSSSSSKSLHTDFYELSNEDMEWVNAALDSMTLTEKCAQLIMPAAFGTDYKHDAEGFDRLVHLVKDLGVGGFILKQGDIKDEMILIDTLQKLSKYPLLFSSDFENGLGMRLSDGVKFPSNMALCAAGDSHLAYLMGKVIGKRGRLLGVNINLAPVEDINDNPWNPVINTRAYSDNKDSVTKYSFQFIEGLNNAQMFSAAKHFPGHGNTKIDSHEELPTVAVDRFNLLNNELVPFIYSINSGVPGILVGHLSVPSIEPQENLPASLSYNVVTGLLKDQLGFKGLVITDAMDMKAVTDNFSTAVASVKAVQAGEDILLMPPDEDTALTAIVSAVDSGNISINRINESVKKILIVKRWFQLKQPDYYDRISFITGIDKKPVERLAKEIADKSITLVKDERNIIPINPDNYYKTACITVTNGDGKGDNYILPDLIKNNLGYVRSFQINSGSRERDYKKGMQIAKSVNLVVMPVYMGSSDDNQIRKIADKNITFINQVLQIDKPVVLISLKNPYLLSFVPEARTYLCSYGSMPISQYAMLDALLGKINIRGKLPISIPDSEYSIGNGIEVNNFKLTFENTNEDTNYNFSSVDNLMNDGIFQKNFPGGVLLIGQNGHVIFNKAFGRFSFDKNSTQTMDNAMYDLGTLTDNVGTETAAMILAGKGMLSLNDEISKYFPLVKINDSNDFSIKDLLQRKAVYDSSSFNNRKFNSLNELLKFINEKNIMPGESINLKTIDLSSMLLKEIVEKISGLSLQTFLRQNLFDSMNMDRTMFNPPAKFWYYCPSLNTDKNNPKEINQNLFSYIQGSEGIFSSAQDLALFGQMLLQNGNYNHIQYLDPDIIKNWINLSDHDLSNSFIWIGPKSGNTKVDSGNLSYSSNEQNNSGCFLLIDRNRNMFIILLTNSPQSNLNDFLKFKKELITTVFQAVDYNF